MHTSYYVYSSYRDLKTNAISTLPKQLFTYTPALKGVYVCIKILIMCTFKCFGVRSLFIISVHRCDQVYLWMLCLNAYFQSFRSTY